MPRRGKMIIIIAAVLVAAWFVAMQYDVSDDAVEHDETIQNEMIPVHVDIWPAGVHPNAV